MRPDLLPTISPRSPSVAARLTPLRVHALCAALALLAMAPADGWAQIRFMIGGEAQTQPPVPVGDGGRQHWRNTLSDQRKEREAAQARRRMTDEERSDLRRDMRDAARGAYREEAPRNRPRR